ncbi:MAG: 6-phosphofructokinase [Chloroflexi bacterium]|nr:6-phosphofructokinase [Chloroflexota bacterium]
MKRIAILTSGGDAPGMNAVIRAAVRTAIAKEFELIGIKRGYAGLIGGEIFALSRDEVSNIIGRGGSILESSRSPEFETVDGRKKAADNLRRNKIEGLIIVGGDGTFRGGALLVKEGGISILGVPSTIDNDVYGTDFTVGFDTAVSCAVEAIDRIRDTARTFERVFFIEVMGHHTGFIALQAAVAGGAEGLVIPEVPLEIEDLCLKLQEGRQSGKKSAIVVVAEAQKPGFSFEIAQEVTRRTGFETRVCVLGHLQRGGSPTAADRILGSNLGAAAIEALGQKMTGIIVGVVENRLTYTPLAETYQMKKALSPRLEQLTRILL